MKKWFQATAFRYFLSYFMIFCISIVGMFLVFRTHLINTLSKQHESQIRTELSAVVAQLTEDINTLYSINTQVTGNASVIMSKYSDTSRHLYQVQSELKKYVTGKPLIHTIGYIDKNHSTLYSYSVADYVSYKDGVVSINTLKGCLTFRPDDYENVGVNHLVCLHNDEINRFVFFPAGSNFNNYSVFYILNNNSLEDACRLLLNDMVVCASLTAPDGSVPISTQSKKSARTLSSPLSKNDTDLYFSESFFGGYRLSAQYRSDVLSGRISAAIRDGLAWYLLIAFSGFALVILCTFSTYHPLYRLAHKFSKTDSDDYNLLRHLDRAIESQQMQNDNLRTRIEHYRTLMQKMLLDSVLVSGSPEAEPGLDIDAYFLLPEQHFIAVFALNAVFAPEKIFEEDDHALLLKQEENTAFYLVNRYFDKNLSHESTLVGIADGIFRKTGAFVGISDSTSSAIDIPSLVEQALSALSCAGEGSPTVLYQNLDAAFSENPTDYQYPHDLINRFSQSLSACDFVLAREALSDLTGLLSDVRAPGDALPDFFIRSVLIDMLSELAIQMDNMSVRFREYEDLYFKALYLCRSCSFLENETEISSCFTEMLDIFEARTVSNFPNAEKIRKIVEENISNPDFSISVLYAGQDISLAYMTRLFKKETGENFSDYLWKVRYKKAVELLEERKMSINEISLAVGYLHPSSFRRKFKQENGESPTNYRTGHT